MPAGEPFGSSDVGVLLTTLGGSLRRVSVAWVVSASGAASRGIAAGGAAQFESEAAAMNRACRISLRCAGDVGNLSSPALGELLPAGRRVRAMLITIRPRPTDCNMSERVRDMREWGKNEQ